jgi:hypothetical protein
MVTAVPPQQLSPMKQNFFVSPSIATKTNNNNNSNKF